MFNSQILSRNALLAATGVSATSLHNMIEREQAGISPAVDGRRGKQRLFSIADAVRASFRRYLSNCAIPAEAGLPIINRGAQIAEEQFNGSEAASSCFLIVPRGDEKYDFYEERSLSTIQGRMRTPEIIIPASEMSRRLLKAVQVVDGSRQVNWESHEVDHEGQIVRVGLNAQETREIESMRLRLHQHQLRTNDDHFEFFERYHVLLEKHRDKMLAARNKQPEVSMNWPG